jgi:hypothetical protein
LLLSDSKFGLGAHLAMLNYSAASFRYEPYPLAVIRPALEPKLYNELVANFPPLELFGKIPQYDYKFSLSEKFNGSQYASFIESNAPWREFHAWLKSGAFIKQTIECLTLNNVDLDLGQCFESSREKLMRMGKSLARGRWPRPALKLRSRFEFSVLKADGGEVSPHTDTPKKIITLVLSMIRDGEWEEHYGGGLDINVAKDRKYAFNWNNTIVPWEAIGVVDTVPFVPNQCVIFVKTFNSLHSVKKMTQYGSAALRKTVTIVIEKNE